MNQMTILKRRVKKEVDNLVKKKKTVVNTNINGLMQRLLVIMKRHIGRENKVSRNEIFYKVYGLKMSDVSELQGWMMWEILKRSMHICRRKTHCFIVSQSSDKKDGMWSFWVAKDNNDLNIYETNINRNILAMKNMVKKCELAVDNEWYKEEWLPKKEKEIKI